MGRTVSDAVRCLDGAPNRSRTCDLALRRGALYPTELPGLRAGVYPLAPGVRTRFSVVERDYAACVTAMKRCV